MLLLQFGSRNSTVGQKVSSPTGPWLAIRIRFAVGRVAQRVIGDDARKLVRAWLAAAASLVFLYLSPFQRVVDAQVKEIRRVLVLDDLGFISSPGFAEVDQALLAGLQKSPYQIEFYLESLEVTLFPDAVSQRRFREEFFRKYSERKPDVIIAAGSDSLKFIAESHEKFLQDTQLSSARF